MLNKGIIYIVISLFQQKMNLTRKDENSEARLLKRPPSGHSCHSYGPMRAADQKQKNDMPRKWDITFCINALAPKARSCQAK